MTATDTKLEKILGKATQERPLSEAEICFLLEAEQKSQIDAIFETACGLRRRYFEDKIFLYGFLYISTFCRNDCNFCFFRKSNRYSQRYRKDARAVVAAAQELAQAGVHLIDLTMGEDPQFFQTGTKGWANLVHIIKTVSDNVGLPIMASPGLIPKQVLHTLADSGVSWYACYQETHQRELFRQLRIDQDYDERLAAKGCAHSLGMLIEEGVLRGVGESAKDIANSIQAMGSLDADQVRVMNFVPQNGTPMSNRLPPDSLQELLTIAVLRLSFPDRLVPATLDVDGLAGLEQRLRAGANVVTSLVPPGQGFAGVAQSRLDIADGKRTTEMVLPVLEACGLEAASAEDYRSWIKARQEVLREAYHPEAMVC